MFQLGNTLPKKPELYDVTKQSDLEEGDLTLFLPAGELRGKGILAFFGQSFFDALKHAVSAAKEAVGGDEHAADALVGALVVEFIDPAADLLLGVEEAPELDAVNELFLDDLVYGFDLAEGLRVMGRGELVLDIVSFEDAVEAADAAPGVEDGASIGEYRLRLAVAAD